MVRSSQKQPPLVSDYLGLTFQVVAYYGRLNCILRSSSYIFSPHQTKIISFTLLIFKVQWQIVLRAAHSSKINFSLFVGFYYINSY